MMQYLKKLMAPFQRKETTGDRVLDKMAFFGLNYMPGSWNARAYFLEGYGKNIVVYRCIRELATAAAAVEIELEKNNTTEEEETSRIEGHPLLSLLQYPSPMHSWDEFIEGLIINYLATGNAYIWRNRFQGAGPPTELHLFSPATMTAVPGPNTFPLAYKRQLASGAYEIYPVDQVTGDCEILHIKMFNPLDQWTGMSPLQAAALGVDIHNAGMKFNKALLDNSARPSGAIKLAGAMPDEMALSRLREEVKIFRQGPENAGGVPLLYGGSEWIELGLSPKDMDFKESMSMSAVSIAAAYGVPFPLIVPDAATFANMRDAREAMWENTVLPMLDKIIGGLSRWLLPVFKLQNARLCYNADNVSALEGKRQRKFDRIVNAKNAGLVTINEARHELDMGPIEGGDVLLVPSSQVPIDMSGLGFDTGVADATASEAAVGKALSGAGYSGAEILEEERNGFGLRA